MLEREALQLRGGLEREETVTWDGWSETLQLQGWLELEEPVTWNGWSGRRSSYELGSGGRRKSRRTTGAGGSSHGCVT